MDEHTNTFAPRSRAKTRRFQVASIARAENFKLKRRELELTGGKEPATVPVTVPVDRASIHPIIPDSRSHAGVP